MSTAIDDAWNTFLGKRVLFPPIVAESCAYLVTADNVLYALDVPDMRADQGRLVWKRHLGASVHEPLHLKDGMLYIGSPQEPDGLMCIEAKSGHLQWRSGPTALET